MTPIWTERKAHSCWLSDCPVGCRFTQWPGRFMGRDGRESVAVICPGEHDRSRLAPEGPYAAEPETGPRRPTALPTGAGRTIGTCRPLASPHLPTARHSNRQLDPARSLLPRRPAWRGEHLARGALAGQSGGTRLPRGRLLRPIVPACSSVPNTFQRNAKNMLA
jgi:hypothetical protein